MLIFPDLYTRVRISGPNDLIMNDFVRMLWEQKVDRVVMLTGLVEDGKVRGHRNHSTGCIMKIARPF